MLQWSWLNRKAAFSRRTHRLAILREGVRDKGFERGIFMKKVMSLALAAAFVAGVQGMALASTPQMVMLDEEEVILEVDEPVESGDILVDEDGEVWEVQ